ncbi:hypothetical protein LTR37_005762 [Vermiconidia calcicola]|uniref:Uncharacterized protein n=1 Tax=Vermiconidia calcicola TaxID=1690605 RepID=A0ACC3NHX2_9PEZI|nr:hypothetical protein LTR37_005762 [Vermiconidia calcicola]
MSYGPILAEESLENYFGLFLWLLLVLACILYYLGLIPAIESFGLLLGTITVNDTSAQGAHTSTGSSSSAGDSSAPVSSAPLSLAGTSSDAASAPSSNRASYKKFSWERTSPPTRLPGRQWPAISDAESARIAQWALDRPSQADLRRAKHDAAVARVVKHVTFVNRVTEIPPPPPSLASADQTPLKRLQAALGEPDCSLFVPLKQQYAQAAIYNSSISAARPEMQQARPASYQQSVPPVVALPVANAAPTPPPSTAPSAPPAGDAAPPPPPTTGPAPHNPAFPFGGGPAAPPPTTTTAPRANPLDSMSLLSAQNRVQQTMQDFSEWVDRLHTASNRDGAARAWQDATRTPQKRQVIIKFKDSLNDICDWARLPEGGVDETKLPKAIWEDRGLVGKRMEDLVQTFTIGEQMCRLLIVKHTLAVVLRAEAVFFTE